MLVEGVWQILAMGLSGFGAWLFATAALQKLADVPRFEATLSAYRIAPQVLIPALTLLVIAFESLAAIGLLLSLILPLVGYPVLSASLLLSLAGLAPALLLGYGLAMGLNLGRGRRSIDCGCGGVPMPLSGLLVARNLVIGLMLFWSLSLLGHLAGSVSAEAVVPLVGPLPSLLVFGCMLVLSFFYLITNQLVANSVTRDKLWGQNQ